MGSEQDVGPKAETRKYHNVTALESRNKLHQNVRVGASASTCAGETVDNFGKMTRDVHLELPIRALARVPHSEEGVGALVDRLHCAWYL